MKKKVFIFLLLLTAGCGRSLHTSWNNFTAYYNTFYNAKKDFNAGLAEIKNQPVTIDTDTPFRVHPKPALAGSDDFKSAIENGNQILRRFPHSEWTDNALLLLGKSYYYLQENFLAIQKFEELISLPSQSSLKQKAVIWKGRTLLEVKSYAKGVQFLQGALVDFKGSWNPQNEAETQVVLAEHFAMLSQWDQAAQLLEPAIPKLSNNDLKGRSYLLLGQMLQKSENYDRAFQAYSKVKPNHPNYIYIYWADFKKAEVLRLSGKVDLAASIYSSMINDDKNIKRRGELYFQLAKTFQAQGKYDQALATYHKILADRTGGDFNTVLSDTYYQLGQLYSRHYNDYKLAAAYFDSSSSQAAQQVETESGAGNLASAYSRYVSLKNEISRTDSLLKLAALSQKALNTKLIEIRQQRRIALQNSQNAIQQTNNTLSNATKENIYTASNPDAGTARFGFLNYQNQEIARRNRLKFKAVWGNRPLVDNWRRDNAVSNTIVRNEADSTVQASPSNQINTLTDKQLDIDLNEIPRTAESKEKLNQNRLNAEYRLGSLFFLTLDQPDSASFYYRRILHLSTSEDLKAQTMYSLYELNNLEQHADSASFYKNKILDKYPHSRYARHIIQNEHVVESGGNEQLQDSVTVLREKVQQLLAVEKPEAPDSMLAGTLRKLALKNRSSVLAPDIYYEGIREYIRFAKLKDSTQTVSDSLQVQQGGGTQTESYSGKNWDNVRSFLTEFKTIFPDASQVQQINAWLDILKNPAQIESTLSCADLNANPRILQGKKHFLQSVKLPDKLKKMKLSGSLRYRFIISKEGKVESYKLLSNPTKLGIEEAYEQAFNDNLQFEPITRNGEAVRASCTVGFPITQ